MRGNAVNRRKRRS